MRKAQGEAIGVFHWRQVHCRKLDAENGTDRIAPSTGRPSAAQNGTVNQTCTQCGAVHEGTEEFCSFCDSRLKPLNEFPPSTEVPVIEAPGPRPRSQGALALTAKPTAAGSESNWREEVASRLETYRARKRQKPSEDLQTALAFEAEEPLEEDTLMPPESVRTQEAEATIERMEIDVTQPVAIEDAERLCAEWLTMGSPGEVAPRPVADLGERQRAGILDAAFLLLAYGAFLGVFKAFGGVLKAGKLDAMVHLAALAVFYIQYVMLFTVLGRGTPGMLIRGLEAVSFDGGAATRAQLVWRSFGYLVSAATAFLGFFWALWDEDRLTWHDRISQTYLAMMTGERSQEKAPVRWDEAERQ